MIPGELRASVVSKCKSKTQKKERRRLYVEGEGLDSGNGDGLLVRCFYGLFQEVKVKN